MKMLRIKYLRELHQLTQSELAKKLNITQPALATYETGVSNPKLDTVIFLSKLFNVSTDYLLGLTDEKYSKEDLELLAKIKILKPDQRDAIMSVLDAYADKSSD